MNDGVFTFLIEMIKGVLGLQESPRLFWLKLYEDIIEAGHAIAGLVTEQGRPPIPQMRHLPSSAPCAWPMSKGGVIRTVSTS